MGFEKQYAEYHRLYDGLLAEKERRIADRDGRIRQLEEELADARAKLSRSKKPEGDR